MPDLLTICSISGVIFIVALPGVLMDIGYCLIMLYFLSSRDDQCYSEEYKERTGKGELK